MSKEEFWVHAVTDTLQGLLAGRDGSTHWNANATADYVEIASAIADRVTDEWAGRFGEKE